MPQHEVIGHLAGRRLTGIVALVRVAGGPQAPGLAGLDSGVSIK